MTTKQNRLYWRAWGQARAELIRRGFSSSEAADYRDDITVETLGKRVSSKALNNQQFDQILAAFRAISDPSNLNAQLDAQEQPLKRLLYSIRNQGFDEPYIAKIALDRWGSESWETLPEPALKQLRMTLQNRARKRLAQPLHEQDNLPF